ncbi:MAG: hypothetical protein H7A36_04945 [Chlamydiales bacterium]|nr:hypothetical protein [Chlamydiales bacterium]
MQATFHSIAYFAQNEGTGHFYHYHKSIQEALSSTLDTTVYVPLSSYFACTPQNWKKWFNPFFNKQSRKKFWKDCVRLFKQPSSGRRIFFIEFFGRRDFYLYALAAALFAKKNDEIWVLYRDDLTIRRKKDLKVIRFWSKILQRRCNFKPFTDNELLADYYRDWFGKRPTVLPILYASYSPVKLIEKEKLICIWLGNPRPDKGATQIARLVEIEDPASSRVELNISGATYLPPVKNGVNIQLRKVSLTEEEYAQALSCCDVVLLPYDPKLYKMRTSGVFVEAILAGKIPVVREGSWLAHELLRFDLHELIVDWEAPNFFSHLFELVKAPKMLHKLEVMQKAYLAFHGKDNFAQSLKDLIVKSSDK